MPSADPLKRLRERRAEEERLKSDLAAVRAGRDPDIHEAVAAGHSQRRVAKAAGISRTRVREILDE